MRSRQQNSLNSRSSQPALLFSRYGRADTEAIILIVSLISGFLGGWWFSGRLLHGVAWAIGLPVLIAAVIFGISYFVDRRP